MKPRKEGTINLIGELLDSAEEFGHIENELYRQFTTGQLKRSAKSKEQLLKNMQDKKS